MNPKSRNDVRDIVTQHPSSFNLQLFQIKLKEFIARVNSFLPAPGFMDKPKTVHSERFNNFSDMIDQPTGPDKAQDVGNDGKILSPSTNTDQEHTTITGTADTEKITKFKGYRNDDYECSSTHTQSPKKPIPTNFDTQPMPLSIVRSPSKGTASLKETSLETGDKSVLGSSTESTTSATQEPPQPSEVTEIHDVSIHTFPKNMETSKASFVDSPIYVKPNAQSNYENLDNQGTVQRKNRPDRNIMTTDTKTKEPTTSNDMESSTEIFFETQAEFPSVKEYDDSQTSDESNHKDSRRKALSSNISDSGDASFATQELVDEMENSVNDLKVKRSQLKKQVSEDPKDKSLAIASQARSRLKRDNGNSDSKSDDDYYSGKNKIFVDGPQNTQHEQGTVEPRNDENRNQRNQKERIDGPSALYANKRNRVQVQWDEGDIDSISDESDAGTKMDNHSKKVKHEKIEHKARKRHEKFTDEEKMAIKNGVKEYGESNWARIKYDIKYKEILNNRTAVQIKDAYRTMKKNNQV